VHARIAVRTGTVNASYQRPPTEPPSQLHLLHNSV